MSSIKNYKLSPVKTILGKHANGMPEWAIKLACGLELLCPKGKDVMIAIRSNKTPNISGAELEETLKDLESWNLIVKKDDIKL